MRFQPIDIGLETIDLETRLLEHQRNQILRRALVTRDRRDAYQVLRQPDAGIRVERLQGPCL